jgi:molybdate transport system regulatory protein
MKPSRIDYSEVLGMRTQDKRLEVLRAIQQTGSISEAARSSAVSYKAAWQAIETLSNLAGVPLVEKLVGGSGGGGARLTESGFQVLEVAELLHRSREQALAKIEHSRRAKGLNLPGLASVGFRTSMRNQFPCRVQEVRQHMAAAQVLLTLPDEQSLIARITHESLELLHLKVGQKVIAMFKATAVSIAPEIVAMQGVNLLQGKVLRRGRGAAGFEVSLQLGTGLALVGFASSQTIVKLRQPAMAAFESNAVVIAVAA